MANTRKKSWTMEEETDIKVVKQRCSLLEYQLVLEKQRKEKQLEFKVDVGDVETQDLRTFFMFMRNIHRGCVMQCRICHALKKVYCKTA